MAPGIDNSFVLVLLHHTTNDTGAYLCVAHGFAQHLRRARHDPAEVLG